MRRLVAVWLSVVLVSACAAPDPVPPRLDVAPSSALPDAFPQSMKGYVLYGWQRDGRTWFTLTHGTNRLKTFDELDVATPQLDAGRLCVRVEGEDAAADLLRRVPDGEFVMAESARHVSVAQNTVPAEVTDPPDDVLRRLDPRR